MPVSGIASAKAGLKACVLPSEDIIFGHSPAMQPIKHLVGKILGTDLPVLIQGENGSGKGLLAQYIHSRSKFAAGACVKVNCAAIPGSLLESELFGYEKGAFTDAHASKPGYVEMADNGTLFLDEISDLELGLQAKILQLLQDRQYTRIGGGSDRSVNIRVICATNRKLDDEVAADRFRQDLFYRINVVTINLPPLRERREDIPALARYFLQHANARFERDAPPFSEDAIESLTHQEWRGNTRELENVVARYAIMGALDSATAGMSLRRPSTPMKFSVDGTVSLKHVARQAVREMESTVILQVLRETKWNRRKAANVLNISYRALIYKIQEAGLTQRHHRKSVSPSAAPVQAMPELSPE